MRASLSTMASAFSRIDFECGSRLRRSARRVALLLLASSLVGAAHRAEAQAEPGGCLNADEAELASLVNA